MNPARDPHALRELVCGDVRGWHIVVLYVLAFVSATVAAHYFAADVEPASRGAARQIASQCLWSGFMLIITLCVPELRRSIGALFLTSRGSPGPSDVALALAVMIAWGIGVARLLFLYVPFLFDPLLYHTLGLGRQAETSSGYVVLAMFGSIVAAPVVEELVFRGYLLNLWAYRYGAWRGLALSSLAFGLAHLQNAPFATGMGLLFGLVYLRYRSLVLCVLLHSAYNALAVLTWPWLGKARSDAGQITSWIAELFAAALFIPLAFFFWRRFRLESASTSSGF